MMPAVDAGPFAFHPKAEWFSALPKTRHAVRDDTVVSGDVGQRSRLDIETAIHFQSEQRSPNNN